MKENIMNEETTIKIPTWFWIVGVIAVIWNLMGLMAFVAQMMMTPEALAALPPDQQKLYDGTPMWVNVVFGMAVIGGTLGSVGLLLRQRWAFPVLVASLAAVLAQMTYLFLSNKASLMGASQMILPALVTVIAVALVWYSHFVAKRGWIK